MVCLTNEADFHILLRFPRLCVEMKRFNTVWVDEACALLRGAFIGLSIMNFLCHHWIDDHPFIPFLVQRSNEDDLDKALQHISNPVFPSPSYVDELLNIGRFFWYFSTDLRSGRRSVAFARVLVSLLGHGYANHLARKYAYISHSSAFN
jgi:hypothetical protein